MPFSFRPLGPAAFDKLTYTVAEGGVFCQVALATASDTVLLVLFPITMV